MNDGAAMKRNGHIILLFCGLAVSFLAYLGSFSTELENRIVLPEEARRVVDLGF